jgi:hypothetical protein
MRLAISFDMDNAAFEDAPAAEAARILREIAKAVEADDSPNGNIRDANGNRVGSWEITEDHAR